jgi:hypothetical protein
MSVRVKVWSLVALVLMVFAAAGCGGSSPAPSPVTPSQEAGDLNALAPAAAAVKRLELQSSYRAAVVLESEGGDKIEGSFEYVAPDRFHIFIQGSIPIEMTRIGPTAYVKSAGSWQQTEPTFLPFTPEDIIRQLGTLSGRLGEAHADAGGCIPSQDGSKDTVFCLDSKGRLRTVGFRDGITKVRIDFKDFDANIEIKSPL